MKTARTALGLVALTLVMAPAFAIDIAADDRGWYRRGTHDSGNSNYLAGDALAGDPVYNFFVFDLADVSEEITSASLRLRVETDGFMSDEGFEVYTLYEVTTDIDELIAGTAGFPGFLDLADGTAFGEVTVSGRDRNATVTVALNSDGLAAVNAARGQRIAIGGSVVSANDDEAVEYVFAFSGAIGSDTRLALDTVDAPVAVSAAGIGVDAVLCENRTDAQTVVVPLPGRADVESADCEAAGLVVNPGDRLRIVSGHGRRARIRPLQWHGDRIRVHRPAGVSQPVERSLRHLGGRRRDLGLRPLAFGAAGRG